jgi:hypothetical protein
MLLHILIFMIAGTISLVTFTQEEPVTEETTEEVAAIEEMPTEDVPTAEEPAPQEATAEEPIVEEAAFTAETTDVPVEEIPTAEETSAEPALTEPTSTIELSAEESAPIQEATPVDTPAFAEASDFAKASTDTTADTQEEQIVIPEEPAEEKVGIDTVSLENPQGNWLFKKIWWERAEERYEKIRQLVDQIWEFRTRFFVARNELDRNVLDPFYIAIGIDQGELQIILAEINDFLEKQREHQEELTDAERMLYETYATEEDVLKQLKSDVESVVNLDHAIDDALGKLMDQINRVRNYEAQAWNNFKEIAHLLNDTKARELYYVIEGSARNIKDISVYLEREFFAHFNKLIGETARHIARVQNQMEALKEKGISFKRQTDLLEEQQIVVDEDEDEEEVAPRPKLGWFAWLGSLVSNVLSSIWSIIRLPYDLIFKK